MYAYTMTKTKVTFASFIQEQMNAHHIKSNRQFAEQVGISRNIINDILNGKSREYEVSSLLKLAEFTGFSFFFIAALAYPDSVINDVDLDARRDAEMISQLPPEKQAIARGYIASAYAEGDE